MLVQSGQRLDEAVDERRAQLAEGHSSSGPRSISSRMTGKWAYRLGPTYDRTIDDAHLESSCSGGIRYGLCFGVTTETRKARRPHGGSKGFVGVPSTTSFLRAVSVPSVSPW